MNEFDVIKQYFYPSHSRKDVLMAIGDDCALVKCNVKQHIAITTDTMVEYTHFFPTISPQALAHKAIMSNLSDLASMGAKPAWLSLAITLPKIDPEWLSAFSQYFLKLLDKHHITLIGGDTTQGALHCITITAQGLLPQNKALCRSQGKAGDYIFVSGTLGDSRGGLELLQGNNLPSLWENTGYLSRESFLLHRHFYPEARLTLGEYLLKQGFCRCAIDISDGLLADLGHILQQSHCHAELDLDTLPLSPALKQCFPHNAYHYALTGGEDYELCFTIPAENITAFLALTQQPDFPTPVTCIGRLTVWQEKTPRIMLQRNGKPYPFPATQGFQHFSSK